MKTPLQELVAVVRSGSWLQIVQNFAARIILGLRKYDHISDSLRSLRWLNVKQRLMVNDAVMMHKCLNGLSPSS